MRNRVASILKRCGPLNVVAILRRPGSEVVERSRTSIHKRICINAWRGGRGFVAGGLQARIRERCTEERSATVAESRVAVSHRERKAASPEDLGAQLPAAKDRVHGAVTGVNFGLINQIAIEVVADVIIGIAVVVSAQAQGIDLTQKRIAVGENIHRLILHRWRETKCS